MYDASVCFMECIRLREYWNFLLCGEYEPYGLTIENRYNMEAFEHTVELKKMGF